MDYKYPYGSNATELYKINPILLKYLDKININNLLIIQEETEYIETTKQEKTKQTEYIDKTKQELEYIEKTKQIEYIEKTKQIEYIEKTKQEQEKTKQLELQLKILKLQNKK